MAASAPSADRGVGGSAIESARDRPLVADRNRLVHRRQSGWAGHAAGQAWFPTVPMPGYQVDVVDEAAKPLPAGTMGSIVIRLPMPPACLPTLWEQDARFKEAYLTEFPGYYKTSDAGYKGRGRLCLRDGPHRRHHQVAGHRLSTGGMEEILAAHPDVAECAVLGINDAIKGRVPCGFLVLEGRCLEESNGGRERSRGAGARQNRSGAAFKLAITVGRLPKTRSGKSCTAPSRRSPTATPGPMPRPSRTLRCSTRSARRSRGTNPARDSGRFVSPGKAIENPWRQSVAPNASRVTIDCIGHPRNRSLRSRYSMR